MSVIIQKIECLPACLTPPYRIPADLQVPAVIPDETQFASAEDALRWVPEHLGLPPADFRFSEDGTFFHAYPAAGHCVLGVWVTLVISTGRILTGTEIMRGEL